jgi:hypothetical protein
MVQFLDTGYFDTIEVALLSDCCCNVGTILEVEVEVGLGGVSRVAAEAEQITFSYFLAFLNTNTALLEVGEKDILAIGSFYYNRIAGNIHGIHVAGDIVVDSVYSYYYFTCAGSK